MKKFLAAFDSLRFSGSTMEYAISLTKACDAHLVGVFLEDFSRHTYSVADMTRYEGVEFERHLEDLNVRDREERNESVETF